MERCEKKCDSAEKKYTMSWLRPIATKKIQNQGVGKTMVKPFKNIGKTMVNPSVNHLYPQKNMGKTMGKQPLLLKTAIYSGFSQLQHGDFPVRYVNVYQKVSLSEG